MAKLFITIRIWEETKEKLEKIRVKLINEKGRLISLAETLEILIESYDHKNSK